MDQYQIGITKPYDWPNFEQNDDAEPVETIEEANEYASYLGIQVTEPIDTENGQWLAILTPRQIELLEKQGFIEFFMTLPRGCALITAQMADEGPEE